MPTHYDQMPFFDPNMMQSLRQRNFDLTTGTADLRLQGQRLVEDRNLFRPFLERRFGRQARRTAGGVANRGFYGPNQGIMTSQMSQLGEEQAHTAGEFERQADRGLTDIERAIANLTTQQTLGGAEDVRQGAGRSAQRAYPRW